MQKLKTPRAAEPNRPGCLKYGATVFCALGASIYLIIALTGYGLTDTSVRPLLFVLSGNYDSRYHNYMASTVKESSRTSDFERNIAL